MRIMEYNTVTKSKVVIDVKWSKLKGNSQAYLSAHIVALSLKGESIHQNAQQLAKDWLVAHNTDKATDMIRLIDNHVVSRDGLDLYKNAYYFYELTRKHTFNTPELKSKINSEITAIRKHVFKSFELLIKKMGRNEPYIMDKISMDEWLVAHFNKTDYKPNLTNVEKFYKHYSSNAGAVVAHKLNKAFDEWLVSYKIMFKEYHDKKCLLNSYNHDTVVDDKDLWTVDRLAIELNITVDEAEAMVLYKIDEVEFADRLHESLLNNKEILDHLTAKYNIPTIKS